MKRLLLLMLLVVALPLAAQQASAPYSALYHALAPGLKVTGYDRLIAVQRIVSKQSGVAPEQIRVVIDARSGRIDVPIARDGRAQFPMTDALLQENPPVLSNQPKGSLSVSLSVEVVLPDSTGMNYADVMAAIMQAEQALPSLEPGSEDRVIRGLEVQLPSATDSATVDGPHGEQLLIADQDGMVFLRRDDDLGKRKAAIRFSSPPTRIAPLVQRR